MLASSKSDGKNFGPDSWTIEAAVDDLALVFFGAIHSSSSGGARKSLMQIFSKRIPIWDAH